MRYWMAAGLLSCLVLGWGAAPAEAEPKGQVIYDITLKGTSNTLDGQKFPFTATGSMSWDEATGAVSFTAATSAGVPFTGDGTLARGAKSSYASTSFNCGAILGNAIFAGKFSSDKKQFSGKFQAGSPNRLGPAPGGFVFTSGSVKALRR